MGFLFSAWPSTLSGLGPGFKKDRTGVRFPRSGVRKDGLVLAMLEKNLEREGRTIGVMVQMYCAGHHDGTVGTLCAECAKLLRYAEGRLAACPFGAEKGPCSKCAVHCYKPEMRRRVQAVMRYAGPRMLTRHPVMGLRHAIKSLKGNAKPHSQE